MTPYLNVGVFFAPHHPHHADPALQLRQDLKVISEIDDMGFDEVWIGEHHSNGSETISAPDLFLASVAERTKHMRLGTGVMSLSYHHPFISASRMAKNNVGMLAGNAVAAVEQATKEHESGAAAAWQRMSSR